MAVIGEGLAGGSRLLLTVVCAVALSALALGAGAAAADAATRHVSTSGSNAANDCLASATPCATIQHAIAAADTGDTVQADAGTYAENLTVAKSVTLRGPNAGVDPNSGDRGPEAIVDGLNGVAIRVQAADVVIEGFTVSTGAGGSPIFTNGADTDGLTIADNIVGSGVAAVRIEAGGEQIAVERNLIAGKGYGVFLGSAATYTGLAIEDNVVTDSPVDFYGIFGGGTIQGLELSGNTIEATVNVGANTSDAIVVGNSFDVDSPGEMNMQMALHQSIVAYNSFEGNGTTGCLQLFGSQFGLVPSKEVVVADNSFHACNAYGIQLSPDIEEIEISANTILDSYDGVNTRGTTDWDVSGLEISVVGNRIVGSTHMGVDNTVAGTLDARDNWWGCSAGPGAPGCDGAGAGVDASTHVVLTAAASAAELASGQSATVTAGLNTNSAGDVVAGVPGSVSFSSPLGALSPAFAELVDGTAASTFTAGPQPGPAAISVGLDGEQVQVPLTIVAPPLAPAPEPEPTPPLPQPVEPPPATPPAIDTPRSPDKPMVVEGSSPTVGTLSCASDCQVQSKRAALKIGGQQFKLKVKMPANIAAGDSAKIRIVLSKGARKALADGKTGTVRVTIAVVDASGRETTRTVKVTIKRRSAGSRCPSC